MFNFFKKKEKKTVSDLVDEHGNVVKHSSVTYDRHNQRFLKLADDCCAMIIHPDNDVEIVFTKLYDAENQKITDNEETLMSLAIFMQQPGFADLIKQEFRRIAMENVSTLTNKNKEH